MDKYTSFF